MSEISPKLVIELKNNKFITDMAKIQLKSDNITPFGGLFSIFNRFNSSGIRKTIDKNLGSRSSDSKAYSYSDVLASLFAGYLCGGDCIGLDFDHQFLPAGKKDTINYVCGIEVIHKQNHDFADRFMQIFSLFYVQSSNFAVNSPLPLNDEMHHRQDMSNILMAGIRQ